MALTTTIRTLTVPLGLCANTLPSEPRAMPRSTMTLELAGSSSDTSFGPTSSNRGSGEGTVFSTHCAAYNLWWDSHNHGMVSDQHQQQGLAGSVSRTLHCHRQHWQRRGTWTRRLVGGT